MDNNSILLTMQIHYTEYGVNRVFSFELYVNRYITLNQLTETVKHLLAENTGKSENLQIGSEMMYVRTVFEGIYLNGNGKTWLYLLQFDGSRKVLDHNDERSLAELGFVTSSTLQFIAKYQGDSDGDLAVPDNAFTDPNAIVYPSYNISTRQIRLANADPVEIISPAEPPSKGRQELVSMLIPPLISMTVMVGVRGLLGGENGLARALLTGAMMLGTVFVTIYSWWRQKKTYIRDEKNWREHYQNYIERKIVEIKDRQNTEKNLLKEEYPNVCELISDTGEASIYRLNGWVYRRSAGDADFLVVRLGDSSQVRSCFEIKGEKKQLVYSDIAFQYDGEKIRIYESDTSGKSLFELPGYLAEQYKYLPEAPLLYSLKNKKAVGIVDETGNNTLFVAHQFLNKLLFEICCCQRPDEVQIVILFEKSSDEEKIEEAIRPFRYFPHFRELFQDRSQFIFDENNAGVVYNHLSSLLDSRLSDKAAALPHIFVVIYNEYGIKEHSFGNYFPDPSRGNEKNVPCGLTFLYATDHREYLPEYCDDVIVLGGTGTDSASLRSHVAKDGEEAVSFSVPELREVASQDGEADPYQMNLERAMKFVSSLWMPKIAEGARIPSAVSLFDIFDGKSTDISETAMAAWVRSMWRRDSSVKKLKTLSVPVGKDELGNILNLDLHEKADGPHMIVAGTTGSGKTETIISYLLALCTYYRPDEVNLMLVDMKGGGFVQRLGMLPHVVGNITDVSGDENGAGAEYMLRRFLASIKAEIKRRKMCFNELGQDNIDDYMFAYQDKIIRDPSAKIAHLFIIIDEFTELKRYSSEHSDVDYIGEVTTIARIGRSLGLHIILISQNIEGAITEDIRVNVKSRLCLKVATRQASKEMIGNELAARPTMPGNGRAYLLVGTGSRFAYFQSAYSGFKVDENTSERKNVITCASRNGKYSNYTYSKRQLQSNTSKTQLESLVKSIQIAYREQYEEDIADFNKSLSPYIVFTNPIPKKITYNGHNGFAVLEKKKQQADSNDESCILPEPVSAGNNSEKPISYRIPVGVYDLPEEAKQAVVYLDPLRNNTMVFGEAMSGKTCFIKNYLIQSDRMRGSIPEEEIYIIDFGGNVGKYASLYAVCACFDGSNEENIKRLFRTLDARLKENADRLNNDSYLSVYENDPTKCPPHLTLIVDNTNAFVENDRYAAYLEKIITYSRDGLSKGLNVILTANHTSGMSKLISTCAIKITLNMPKDTNAEIFGVRTVDSLIKTPGRGYIMLDSKLCEYQSFLPFENENKELPVYLQTRSTETNPKKLVAFTNVPLTRRMLGEYSMTMTESDPVTLVPIGLDYYTHQLIGPDLNRHRGIAITGKHGFGKTNALKLLVEGIIRLKAAQGEIRFVCLDDGRKGLQDKELQELLSPSFPTNEGTDRKISSVCFTNAKDFDLYTYKNGYGGIIMKTEQVKNMEIRWDSDDPNVASVDAGTGDVTAKKPGEANISAVMRTAESEKTAHFKVTVKDVELVKDGTKELSVGDTQRLNAIDERVVSGAKAALTGRGYDGSASSVDQNRNLTGAVSHTPFTVFILQNQAIYNTIHTAEITNLKNWLQKSMAEAEARGYLFIFSDVGRISNETVDDFNNLFDYHLILENIEDFAVRNGGKNIIGSKMDPKDLKKEYASCDLGDGYSYDVESDELHKIRFIAYEKEE